MADKGTAKIPPPEANGTFKPIVTMSNEIAQPKMTGQRRTGYAVAAVYAVATAIAIAVSPDPRNPPFEKLLVGLILGMMFGQTTAASIWGSLGTGSHLVRMASALTWLLALVGGFTILMWRTTSLRDDFLVFIFGTLLGQSALIHAALWGARATWGVRLVPAIELGPESIERVQFGIAHMMAFTFGVAVVLGVLQALVQLSGTMGIDKKDFLIFLVLGLSAILITLPVAVAVLIHRGWLAALLIAVGLVSLVAAGEYPLLVSMELQTGGPEFWHVVWINVFSVVAVFLHALGMRWYGYRLDLRKR